MVNLYQIPEFLYKRLAVTFNTPLAKYVAIWHDSGVIFMYSV